MEAIPIGIRIYSRHFSLSTYRFMNRGQHPSGVAGDRSRSVIWCRTIGATRHIPRSPPRRVTWLYGVQFEIKVAPSPLADRMCLSTHGCLARCHYFPTNIVWQCALEDDKFVTRNVAAPVIGRCSTTGFSTNTLTTLLKLPV